jgi:hypothetical protein
MYKLCKNNLIEMARLGAIRREAVVYMATAGENLKESNFKTIFRTWLRSNKSKFGV